MSNKNVTKIERLSSGMVKLYNRSNVIGAFSALNSISIGYENNNARTIQFTDNGNTISFQLFNLQQIIGSTTTVTYDPIDVTSTGLEYNNRVFEVFDFLSSEVFQGFSPGPTYVGGVVAAYPNFASFPVTGTQSVIYIDEADNSAYYWDGTSYQLLVSTGVEQYASFALFPVTGSANVIYIDMSVPEPYVWNGTAYESMGGGSAVWGGITGTLAAQTDLQAALDAKFDNPTGTSADYLDGTGTPTPFPGLTGYVPYTGATTNVDLGEYEIKAGQVEFDQTPTGAAGVAVMRWNDTDGTADLGLKGGNVTLQLGQEMVIRAVNKSGGDLLEANYQAVRLRLVSEGGASGQRLAVKLALADSDINSATTIGLVTETINNNQEGFVTTIGVVREINTTGSLQGETWVDGDILYLSPTVAGQLTNVKPVAPDHLVVVGYVEYAHAIHGKIYVKCDNGYELDELHNVYINSPTTWQVLRYDATAGYWTNSSLTASILPSGIDAAKIGAGTVDNTEFGYLDGVTSSIQTQINNKFTLPSLTSGSVLFSNGTTIAQSNANFFWDNTNARLGIGTATPAVALDVRGQTTIALAQSDANNAPLVVQNLTAYSNPFTQNIQLWKNSVGTTVMGLRADGFLDLPVGGLASPIMSARANGSASAPVFTRSNNATTGIFFPATNNIAISTNSAEALRIFSTSNVAIGTTTDAGYKLDVNGTARVSGTTTITPAALTGTAATSALDISQTWNTTGTPIAFKLNITDTASATLSDLISLQVGGSVRFRVLKSGYFSHNTGGEIQGSLVVGSASINASAILQSDSVTKGFLPPRMTTAQKNAIATPAAGLVVYDTTLNKLCVRGASAWETITSI